ncbi:MAG: helix-turn-helix domain-containing protein [Sulfurifustaceae bacterium]
MVIVCLVLSVLVDLANMSRSKFAAVFEREVGETPGDYVIRWRVTVAQTLIQAGTRSPLFKSFKQVIA